MRRFFVLAFALGASGCSGGGSPVPQPPVPAPPASVAPVPKGIHARFWTLSPGALARVAALGARVVRTPLPYDIWGGIASALPPWIDAVRAGGGRPLFVTSFATHQGASSAEIGSQVSTAALATFYAQRAAENPGCAWEIGNEPDIASPSNAAVAPADDAAYLLALARAIRAADPSATIVSGGTSGIKTAYLRAVAAAGGLAGVDAIGLHPYGVAYDSYAAATADVRALGKPLWFTEYGTQGTDQSGDVLDYLRASSGVVNMAVWFQADDNSDGTYGLMLGDGTPKPSYGVFARF